MVVMETDVLETETQMPKCVRAHDKSLGVNIESLACDSCVRQNRKPEVGPSIELA